MAEKTTWWIETASFKDGIWTVCIAHSNDKQASGIGYSHNKRGRSLARIIEEVALEALELQAKGIEFNNERSCMRTIAEGT